MAVAMMAVGPFLRGRGIVLTGEGADTATLGGHPPVSSQEEFDDGILAEAAKYWTDRRPAVDIGEVVDAGAPARWCRTMQHSGLLAITRRIDYRAMWRTDGAGRTWDKVPLRMAAAALGVPEEVVWRPKSPIQRSSGILDAMLTAACEQARELPGTEWGPRPSAQWAPRTSQEASEVAAVQFWLAAQLMSDAE
ncbi:hypothetical protein ACH4YO_31565 [Streptomyces noursei]|uniref:hypothetical protein n=1 Tax=Streptomyces noursei TaxID=1971 RepID=UPI0033CADCA7